jgi:hypothetical protein
MTNENADGRDRFHAADKHLKSEFAAKYPQLSSRRRERTAADRAAAISVMNEVAASILDTFKQPKPKLMSFEDQYQGIKRAWDAARPEVQQRFREYIAR